MNRSINLIGIFILAFLTGTILLIFSEEGSKPCAKLERTQASEIGNPQQARIEESKGDGKKSLGARAVILPAPVWVIGSYDKEGKPNVMTSSWVGICCSKPPCVMTCLRKATYTFGNIMERKAYTVNIPSESFAKQTAYFGRVSGRDVNKFLMTGLTPVKSALVDAPYIKEFSMVIECKLLQAVELGSHTMFIGEIMDVKADEFMLGEKELPDMEKLKPFVYAPSSSNFYRIGQYLGNVSDLAKDIGK